MERRVALRGGLVVGLGLTLLALAGCTTPASLHIDQVDYATQFWQNGPRLDLSVYWSGNPKLPITMVTTPNPGCTQGPFQCSPASQAVATSEPLVWKQVDYCSGNTPTTNAPWRFSYDVSLRDAAGHQSESVRLLYTCYFGVAPVRLASIILHHEPWLTQVLRPATDVSWKLTDVARSVVISLGLIFLIAFPSQLFNSTLQSHYEEVTGWFSWLPRPSLPGGGGSPRWLLAAVFVFSALLSSLLDPHWGIDRTTLEALLGLLLANAFTTTVYTVIHAAYLNRVTGLRGYLRVYGGGIVVAIGCVLVSRLFDAQPGYLYGVLLGYTLGAAAPKLARHHEGRNVALGSLAVLLVSVAVWLLWTPIKAGAEATEAFPLVVLSTAMAGVFLGGLTSLMFSLLPLRWLDGEKLLAWQRLLWLPLVLVALFLFVHVVLNNAASTPHPGRNFALTIALFFAFGAVSTGFWAYFRFRPEPLPGRAALPA